MKPIQEAKPKAYSRRSAATLIANDIMCMLGGAAKQPKITRVAFMAKDPKNALAEISIGGLCKEALVGRIEMAIERHGIAVIG